MVQCDPSLLKSVKKNTLGTLFVFEVIRFRKKLLNLKEHPIPSLGLSVVLHRESFCFCAEHKNQMLVSVMPKRAWARLSTYAFVRFSILSPYVFVYFGLSPFPVSLALRVCALQVYEYHRLTHLCIFMNHSISTREHPCTFRLRRLYVIGLQRPPSSTLDLCACVFSTYKRLYFMHNANNIPSSTN